MDYIIDTAKKIYLTTIKLNRGKKELFNTISTYTIYYHY